MATDLVISPSVGSVAGGPTVTLKHGIQNIANYATNIYDGVAWIGIKEGRPRPPWGKIAIAGVDGVFAKYWGVTDRQFFIRGVIAVRQATIDAAYPKFDPLLDNLEKLQTDRFEFNITGPRTIGPVVCDAVDTDFLGPNTGGNWFFTLVFGTLES